jgi:hypothetical protein
MIGISPRGILRIPAKGRVSSMRPYVAQTTDPMGARPEEIPQTIHHDQWTTHRVCPALEGPRWEASFTVTFVFWMNRNL